MADDNSTRNSTGSDDGTSDRKFPVVGLVLTILLILLLFVVIFFYGQCSASPFNESNSVGP